MSDTIRMRAKYVSIVRASARGVADRWRGQYYDGKKWTHTAYGDSSEIYNKLVELGRAPDIAKVAEIIGNQSWSYLTCSGCNDSVEHAVELGEYETRSYCRTCIVEAMEILNRSAS